MTRKARETRETEAKACRHNFTPFKSALAGPCKGHDVATGIDYIVHVCANCDTRRDVCCDTGETFREYIAVPPQLEVEPEAREAADAADYVPQYDGIDPFTSHGDSRPGLFLSGHSADDFGPGEINFDNN